MASISDFRVELAPLDDLGYTLRYELTIVVLVFLGWCFGKVAGWRRPKKARDFKNLPQVPTSHRKPRTTTPKPSGKRDIYAQLTPDQLAQIDPSTLCDSSWLVPQVLNLSRSRVQEAVMLYRAAVKAGLEIQQMPEAECQKLFVALVTSSVRTQGMDDAIELLRDLHTHGPGIPASLFASTVKLCTSKHLYDDCLAVYDFASKDANLTIDDKTIWSCLLYSAMEKGHFQRCEHFFKQLKECGTPSTKDYGNMVRVAQSLESWQLSMTLLEEMRASDIEIDMVIYNTALATCVAASQLDKAKQVLKAMEAGKGSNDIITYNTLMKGFANAGQMDQCVELFDELKARSLKPSQVTYGILLDGFINANQAERAAQIFNDMREEGGTMNTVLYTTLIKGFARIGQVDQAMKVYEEMRNESEIMPDLITFSILIKANCDSDRLEEGLKLLEAMCGLGLQPDEVVFNNLLSGCGRQSNLRLGKQLYSDMVKSGVKPSNATFSILIRFYHQCKLLDDAIEMLRTEPALHQVRPEPRLFSQLIQACIRERHGRRAVEVYQMMTQSCTVTASAHSSIFKTCLKLNMFDTAAEIMKLVAQSGGRVDMADAGPLLQGAARKSKTQIAHDIAASMVKLGLLDESEVVPQSHRP